METLMNTNSTHPTEDVKGTFNSGDTIEMMRTRIVSRNVQGPVPSFAECQTG
jgi:hypothetical protein